MIQKPFVTIGFDSSSAPGYVKEGYNIVAIDVLRATSTIIVALAQGAKSVIPCVEIEATRNYKQTHGTVTIGERLGDKLPGFDFTNSPYDLSKADLTDKIVAITSTTGTPLITNSLGARHILIGSTLNAYAVAKSMQELGGNWTILGAGYPEEFIEDQVGCAVIANRFIELTQARTTSVTKKIVKQYSRNVKKHILASKGIPLLLKLGRKCDIDFVVAATNAYTIVPVVREKEQDNVKLISITKE